MIFTGGNVEIKAVVIMRANLAVQIIQQLCRRLTCLYHKVEEIEPGKDAITFRNVSAETIAATFLTTDESIFFCHQRRYIFKAYSSFIYRDIEEFAQSVKHIGRSQSLYYCSLFAANLQEIECE